MNDLATKALPGGFEMPALSMGLWRQSYKTGQLSVGDEAEEAAIKFSLEKGLRSFDTAPLYGNGHSETHLGKALRDVARSEVFIVSKVWITEMTPDKALASVEASLERLQMEYLDLLLLHYYPKPPLTLDDAAASLDACVEAGLVNNVGAANFGARALSELSELTEAPIVCNQVHYNVQVREPDVKGLTQYCADSDVLLSAWRPLGYGKLASSGFLEEIGRQYQASGAQVALAWLLAKRNVVTTFKSDNPDHIEANIAATLIQLSQQHITEIDQRFPDQLPESDSQPLTNGDVMKDFG